MTWWQARMPVQDSAPRTRDAIDAMLAEDDLGAHHMANRIAAIEEKMADLVSGFESKL